MDNYRAVALAEGFEDGPEAEVLAAWQHLVDTGIAWQLQGWFGRSAAALLREGTIEARTPIAIQIAGLAPKQIGV